MSQKKYFTPGPSQLYPGLENHFFKALKEDIPSISHRSKTFEGIFREATENLRSLLGIPGDYSVLFAASATAIWEILAHNLVHRESLHLVNGSFSKRFFEIVKEWKKPARSFVADEGHPFDLAAIHFSGQEDLLALILNETSTGVQMLPAEIAHLRKQNPNLIMVADGVSAFPSYSLDFSLVDAAYFSVQKGFGLPAGLGVLIASPRLFEKAAENRKSGFATGSYQDLNSMKEKAQAFQTNETPNVLGLYLLSKVTGDMLSRGIEAIRREDEEKSRRLYSLFDRHPLLSSSVKSEAHRSLTVGVAEVAVNSDLLVKYLATKNLVIASGYGKPKDRQVRIANFPAVSLEDMELLISEIESWQA